MGISFSRITIIKSKIPQRENINEELQWFGQTLGLFNKRDKEQSCFRLFIALLRALKQDRQMSSDELAFEVGLSRGTVVHHLNKLMEAGIVAETRNKYFLKVENLEKLTEQIQGEMNEAFDFIKRKAKDIDKKLRL